MPVPNPAAMEFLLTRRSRPAKTLGLPVPNRDQLGPLPRAVRITGNWNHGGLS